MVEIQYKEPLPDSLSGKGSLPDKLLSIIVMKNGKKTISHTAIAKLLVFCGLIGLSAVLMQPLQAALNQIMHQIHTNLIKNLEKYTGLEVVYSSIRPAFWGSFDIRNLKFIKNQNPFFTVSRVRFSFSIKELIIDKKISIHTVQIERPVINIDTERDKETLEILSSLFSGRDNESEAFQQILRFLPQNANYQIRNGYFHLLESNFICLIDDISINIRREAPQPEVNLAGAPGASRVQSMPEYNRDFLIKGGFSAVLETMQILNREIIVRTGIEFNGLCSGNFKEVTADAKFLNFSVSEQGMNTQNLSLFRMPIQERGADTAGQRMLFSVRPFSTALSYKDSIFAFLSAQGAGNSDFMYSASYHTGTGDITAEMNFNNFRMDSRIFFSEYWNEISNLLRLHITGDSSFSYKNGEDLEYNINIEGGRTFQQRASFDTPGYFPLADAFVIDVYGDNKKINVNNLILSSSEQNTDPGLFYGVAGYSGVIELSPLMVDGKIVFDRFSFSGADYMAALFNITGKNDEIRISSDEISIAGVKLYDTEISMYLQQNIQYSGEMDIDFSLSSYNYSGKGGASQGAIFLDGIYSMSPGRFEASLTLDSISIYEITELIRPFTKIINFPAISGNFLQETVISADLFASSDFANIVYNIPKLHFTSGGFDGNISLTGTNRQFTINEGIININDNQMRASASMDFSDPMMLDFTVNSDYLDYAWRLSGQILDRSTLILNDPNGLSVYGTLSDTGAVSGYVESMDFPVPVNDETVYLSFFSTLRYNSADLWNLDIDSFSAAFNGGDTVRFSSAVNQNSAVFRNIIYSDSISTLSGTAGFSWDTKNSVIEAIISASDGRQTGESYSIECIYNNGEIDVWAYVSDMYLNRFTKNSETMLVSGNFAVSWNSLDSFNANANVTSFSAILQNNPVSASVSVYINNNEFFMHNLKLVYGDINAELKELHVDRVSGIAETTANFQKKGSPRIAGNLELNAAFSKVDSWINAGKIIDEIDGTLTLRDAEYNNLRQDEMTFTFSRHGGDLSVSGGIKNMLRLQMDSEGSFFAGLSSPMPIQGTIIGTLKEGILDAQCNNFFLDLKLLWDLVPNVSEFSIAGGYITGKMDFRGPLLNPEFYGRGRASSVRFQIPNYVNADLRPVPFEITADGYDMTFGPFIAAAGSGSGIVNGWFTFEKWIPASINLNIKVPPSSPIPYDFNISGFLANGNASGDLDILVDIFNNVLAVTGNLYTNDAELGLNFNDIGAVQNNTAASFNNSSSQQASIMNSVMDFTITTGSMVEFVWPASSPIIRANPELGTVIYATSDSQSGQYSLRSDVRIRSGELFYFDRSFYIRQGSISFRENENQFDPRISARA